MDLAIAWRRGGYGAHTQLHRNSQLDNTGTKNTPLQVPGLNGIDLDASTPWGGSEDFPEFATDLEWDNMRATAREVAMVGLVNEITDRPDWHRRIFNEDYVVELAQFAYEYDDLISEKAWAWCLQELRFKARRFEETGRVAALDVGSGVCKVDSLVSERTKAQIQEGLDLIRRTREGSSSDGQAQQLIDPSLYPLVFGKTPILLNGGIVGLEKLDAVYTQVQPMPIPTISGQRCPFPRDVVSHRLEIKAEYSSISTQLCYTTLSQWLPCEVDIAVRDDESDEKSIVARITSYINNLHPKLHASLYSALEDLIALAIPAWNETIVRGDGSSPMRISTFGAHRTEVALPSWWEEFAEYHRTVVQASSREKPVYNKMSPEYRRFHRLIQEFLDLPEVRPGARNRPHDAGPEDWENNLDAAIKAKFSRMTTDHPEPGISYSFEDWTQGRIGRLVVDARNWPEEWQVDYTLKHLALEDRFREQGLQIVVKATSIELSPDALNGQNVFSGDCEWQAGAGPLNERITATALFVVEATNITSTTMEFRQPAWLSEDTHHAEEDAFPIVFGFPGGWNTYDRGPVFQPIGAITLRTGRFITFPVTTHSRLSRFELQDQTRAGRLSLIYLYLVDPNWRIVSTRNVPPQQSQQRPENMNNDLVETFNRFLRDRLPQELVDQVSDELVDWGPPSDEAREIKMRTDQERALANAERIEQKEQSGELFFHYG